MQIIVSKSLPIVSRLGEFLKLMSFLESIGKLIGGSGLNVVLETIYGQITVEYIIAGKSLSRAIRGHLLVDTALHTTLITQLFPEYFLANANDFEDESKVSTWFKELRQLYEDLASGESIWHEVSRRKTILISVRQSKIIKVIYNIHTEQQKYGSNTANIYQYR